MSEGQPSESVVPNEWERYRVELTGYCYRMLGSPFDAEDAVQETFLRAWRSLSTFDESRSSPRTWLYRIATNLCLDMLKSATRRRELAVDMGPAFPLGPDLGTPLPEDSWVLPITDTLALPRTADPLGQTMLRESIRLAFVAALQLLPPRQRAVLILRDVLSYAASEVAGILETTTASVNSALQRARATLADSQPGSARLDPASEDLLTRYCEAFENDDIDALVALLHEDGTTSMPPYPWWLRGRAAIEAALRAAGNPCAGSRLVPVRANGTTAVAQYSPDGEGHLRPFGLTVIEWLDGKAFAQTTFLVEAPRLFRMFGLTDEFHGAASYTST
ncbi:RNA polymerase subunit sigma-70 [Phytoactinopolyspora mesophila]|uniref:Sigma-70 family RNA polymerase sigma factor n=1 Tax=Phytoactinopolyspora mesophila TaxID=2650750 RepID=A0A7K3LZ11_9ACTN|nr:RNA polymerase subunit sigma-70 [Phytoactinopolyspora mesophila]NDL56239.1 sigma-70 family RNA polymerase sigma factor [Phytoactinopolyspora mesophila]